MIHTRNKIMTTIQTPKKTLRMMKGEKVFDKSIRFGGIFMIALVLGILFTLILGAFPSIHSLGVGFLYGKIWDPVHNLFGAMPFLIGTLLTSFVALLISIPFSMAIALFLGEYFPKGWISNFLKGTIELIAAVPSVIFGFWGFFVLVPIIRTFQMKIGIMPNGVGIFSAALILAIMIIPYAASLGTSIIKMVPSDLKEGAYALGATRWEVLKSVILPYSKSGIFAGILLSLGRAVGETMAVTMVIGNANILPDSIFSPGNTMASVIANQFTEADNPLYLSALIEMGLFLFLVTFLINIIGKRIIKKTKNNN